MKRISKNAFSLIAVSLLLFSCATAENESLQDLNSTNKIDKEVVISSEARALAKTDLTNADLGEKLVCKREKKTGTRFTTKVCRTKQEVEDMRNAAQDDMATIQRSTTAAPE